MRNRAFRAVTLLTAAAAFSGCASTVWHPGPDQTAAEWARIKYVCAQESRVDPVYPPPRDFSQGRTGPGGYRPGALTAGGQVLGAGIAARKERNRLYDLCMEAQGAVAETRE